MRIAEMTRPKVIRVGTYDPRRHPRLARAGAWMIGRFLRAAMKRGWVIVMIGPTRTGKTFMLERATPGKVINKKSLALNSAGPAAFDLSEVPSGLFSIDEPTVFDRGSLLGGIETLRGRGFAITFQQSRMIDELGLTKELQTNHRCIALHLKGRRENTMWWTKSEHWK